MSTNTNHKSGILATLSNPWFGIAGTIASIAGFLVGFYFYYASRERPDLIYMVHPIRTTLVKGAQTSRIRATFDGFVMNEEVSAAQIVIWNRGNRSIRKENILRPVTINIDDGRILEATVLRVSRDVTGVNLSQNEDTALQIVWNILEQNDGFIVQIIYTGKLAQPIRTTATIEGQQYISELRQEIVLPNYAAMKTNRKLLPILSSVVAVLYAFIFFFIVRFKRRNEKTQQISPQLEMAENINITDKAQKLHSDNPFIGWLRIFIVLVILVSGSYAVYLWILSYQSDPPFPL